MAFSNYGSDMHDFDYYINMHDFSTMALPQFVFGSAPTESTFPTPQTPAVEATPKCANEQRLRRRILNRISARRCRERKQNHLNDLQRSVAPLEARRRKLAVRARATLSSLALVRLANARLRAEAAALSRRLLAARQYAVTVGLVVDQAVTSLVE
ncbi:unnamed protein product [Urochloa humidicola]